VPPKFAAAAIIEAAEGGITFIVCITGGHPPAQDEAVTYTACRGLSRRAPARSNCPGIISPGSATSASPR